MVALLVKLSVASARSFFLFCDAFTVMFVQRRALVAGEAMRYWVLTSQS